jgi:hypothetical protein
MMLKMRNFDFFKILLYTDGYKDGRAYAALIEDTREATKTDERQHKGEVISQT